MESNSTKQKGLLVERPRGRRTLTQCAVCSMPALYSYAGAIVCSPCKVFFKRNATNKIKQLKCHYDGNCEVNENTRHVCAACRLAKCFASGMESDLLRSAVVQRKQTTTQIRPLNLLQTDQSTLQTSQWELLSNLIHCYDENISLSLTYSIIQEQNRLPIKARYKIDSVNQFFMSLVLGVQSMFEKNGDFLSLAINDQIFFLKRTLKQISGLVPSFILRVTNLFDEPVFIKTVDDVYGHLPMFYGAQGSLHIDQDPIIVKLLSSAMMFSTLDCTYHLDRTIYNLGNPRQALAILDTYAEITWRYLLYKYDFNRAVHCFSGMLRWIFLLINSMLAGGEAEDFKEMVDCLTERTKGALHIID